MATMTPSLAPLPKAELHVHLEGSISEQTLIEINPSITLPEARGRYTFATFADFLRAFAWVTGQLTRPEHYGIAVRRLLEDLEARHVRYVEVTLSAGVALRRGHDLGEIHDAIREAAARSGVECHWIWDAVRQWPVEMAEKAVELAAARAGDGVIAFGLGGDEAGGSATLFGEVFRYAREHGLRLVCHAGETTGPRSIWEALEIGAERIGHGLSCVEDPALLDHLRTNRIPVEVSIGGNRVTGAAPDRDRHPIQRMVEAGLEVNLNTDDPGLFGTDLDVEYANAAALIGAEAVERLRRNAFEHAFRWRGGVPS